MAKKGTDMSRGVQNAQMQGPASRPTSTVDVSTAWWSTFTEGDRSTDGLTRV